MATPLWDPRESKKKVYQRVHVHSPGMISFTYRPASAETTAKVLEELKKTEAYRLLQRLKGG